MIAAQPDVLAATRPLDVAERAPDALTVTVGPVLVATDGTAQSEPAMTLGHELATRCAVSMRVLTVVESLPMVGPEVIVPSPDLETGRRADALRAARVQTARLAGPERWTVEVRTGAVAPMIARVAQEMAARLIVVGLGKHDLVHRLFGGETALHLIREANAPVLAVASGTTKPPRRIVAAIDFNAPSLRAAKAALELADEGATLTLVHVIPWEAAGVIPGESWSEYEAELDRRLARIAALLRRLGQARVEHRVLTGPPARRIVEYATETGADLIATGTRGRSAVARLVLGQTAGTVLRGATCSVLTVPYGVRGSGIADR